LPVVSPRAPLLALSLLAVPAALAAFGARWAASRIATRVTDAALQLARPFAWMHEHAAAPQDLGPDLPPEGDPAAGSSSREGPAHATSRPFAARMPSRLGPPLPRPSGGIFVHAATVRAAVRAGVRPSATPVGATEAHPAGLVVSGWGGAGTGLRDGDLVVRVGGATPRSAGDVAAAVAAAYRSKIPAVSGLVWRGGQTLSVVVELPPPEPTSAANRLASSERPGTR
jgi:hypothetical protein